MLYRRAPIATWLLSVLVVSACSGSSGSSNTSTGPSGSPSAAHLTVSRTTYDFPQTPVGDTSTSSTFDVSASGSGSLTVTNVVTSNPTEFSSSDAASCIGMTLTSTVACHITVKFKPAAPGVRTAQITVSGSDGNNVAIAVFGTASSSDSSGSGGGGGGGGTGSGGGSGGSSGGGGGSFPQPPCVPNHTQNISLSIVNTVSFVVQLSVDGPTHQTSAILPSGILVVPVQPGNYTISGSAPASPNVVFTPSTWTVASGCDYLMQVVANP